MKKSIKTIADIAELAGVSKSTVSRALNDSSLISTETRQRIKAIAKEHQFETHRGARCLSLNSSQTLALIVPEFASHERFVPAPFFMEMLQGVTYAVADYGYDLLLGQPRGKINVANEVGRFIDSKRADGLIFLGWCAEEFFSNYDFKKSPPVIICGSDVPDRICSVDCDNLEGGRLATEHLLELGRKKIAFLGGIENALETKTRFEGYKKTLADAEIEVDPSLIVYGDYTRESAYYAAKQLLEQNPDMDALFACSDTMAMGAMEIIREKGLSIGEDIAVVGFDDIPMAQFSCPSLTTVRQNIFKVGETLVHNLMRYLKDEKLTREIMPVELVVRKSTIP